jgi:phosphoglycolate phosphatase
MKHLELYIFDLDGTLLDSGKDITLAANYAFERLNLKTFSEEDIISKVGYGAKKLIEDLIPEYPQEIKDKALGYFKEFYYSNPVIYSKLYDGAEETLKRLKELSKKVAVVTNKYEALSVEILKRLNVIDCIDLVVGADTTSEKKPHPLPVFYTLEKLRSDKDKSIIIGDSETDVLTGKNAGIKTALVLQGYGNKELALSLNPDYVLDSLKFI